MTLRTLKLGLKIPTLERVSIGCLFVTSTAKEGVGVVVTNDADEVVVSGAGGANDAEDGL